MPAEPGANEQDWNQRSQPQTLNSHQSAPLVSRYAAIVSEHEGNSHESENSQRVGRRNPPFAVDSANERPSEGGQQYASRYGKRHEQAQCPIKACASPFPGSRDGLTLRPPPSTTCLGPAWRVGQISYTFP